MSDLPNEPDLPAADTPEQALKIARFCWPEDNFCLDANDRIRGQANCVEFEAADCLAAAERVLIERGLGKEYGRALRHALLIEDAAKDRRGQYLTDGEIASVRTASPDVIARAILRVVEGQEKQQRGTSRSKRRDAERTEIDE